MSYRFDDFSDDELVVIDAALNEDEGSWHDEEKEGIRKALIVEAGAAIEARGIIPND